MGFQSPFACHACPLIVNSTGALSPITSSSKGGVMAHQHGEMVGRVAAFKGLRQIPTLANSPHPTPNRTKDGRLWSIHVALSDISNPSGGRPSIGQCFAFALRQKAVIGVVVVAHHAVLEEQKARHASTLRLPLLPIR